jgi:glycosyltransferase involved in cell wall biosynthesis
MNRPQKHRNGTPLMSIAHPVYNGAETLAPVIESVLGQDYPDIELVISDNASTDGTEELCRHFAAADERVVYRRHATNIGLLNNFMSAAEASHGTHVRWLGDDDTLEPDYVSRTLAAFAEDDRRVLVTTQISYVDDDGSETVHADYDASPLSSSDPVVRFAEMLRLLTSGFAVLDPLYGVMRRDVALLPRRNILREDEVFAARLALAGPWGHVAVPLAHRHRSHASPAGLVRLLGVPAWHRHAMDVLQVRDLSDWIAQSSLDPGQRRRARSELLKLYGRRKRNTVRRGYAKVRRTAANGRLRPVAEA